MHAASLALARATLRDARDSPLACSRLLLSVRCLLRCVPQTNPLALDRPGDSFTPGDANGASAAASSAAASSTPAAAASSGGPPNGASNKAAKQAARAATATSGTVLYGAVRKFSELPISQRTLRALTEGGFTRLTDIQRASIPHALAGRDILGAARTGSGKTLAYLVPVLERLFRDRWGKQDGVGALILAPTRELAMQIFDVLRVAGKTHSYSAGLVIGGKELVEEQERILGMNILVATPGRLLQHFEQTYGFACDNLQILVLDEADRILDMGFQQTLTDILSYLPQRQTLLFSATQTRNIKELAKLSLRNPEYIAVHESAATALPNRLQQHYTLISADQKINLLYSFIKTHLQAKSIVFLSSGKQVRFIYEVFRRIRPGVPLLHIHGKMKQAKRMALYYDYCSKSHALLFCTDLAARGLDFPDVDWVVQMDAPDTVATYIHRVGRTARYRAGGKSLLFLLPSETAFIEALQSSGKLNASGSSALTKVRADAAKMKDITAQVGSLLAENTELKFLAQKAFISYVRSVALQADKAVFQAEQIPFDALAKSMGLIGAPKVKLPKNGAASSLAHKEKNMPHALRELLAEKKGGADAAARKAARKAARLAAASGVPLQPMTAVERILTRQNATVFSKSREKLRATTDSDEGEDGEGSDDDILRVRRKDHDLSSDEDEDDEDEVQMSSESESAASDDEDDEAKPASSNKALLRTELAKRASKVSGDQIQPKSAEEASDDFLAVAAARVKEHDPQDRQREHERVKAKHLARKIATKKALRAQEREDAAAAGDEEDDDGVVVTLGRPDDEDDDGGEGQSDDGEDDDERMGGDSGEDDDDAPDADEEEEDVPAVGSKRKAAPAAAAKSKKAKTQVPTSIADQEALALKILGMQ